MARRKIPGRVSAAERRLLARSTTIYCNALDPVTSADLPADFPPDARKEFDALMRIQQHGCLLNLDQAIIYRYCVTEALLKREEKLLRKEGCMLSPRMRNPRFALVERLQGQVLDCLIQLRMTPLSRAEFAIRTKNAKSNALPFRVPRGAPTSTSGSGPADDEPHNAFANF
jgi:hypothetical protein